MTGTLVNTGAIIAGSAIGVIIRSGLPEKIVTVIFQGIGLFITVIGISMSLKSENMILIIISLVVGAIVGQGLGLKKIMTKLSEFLHTKFSKEKETTKEKTTQFTKGLITATMLFCVGSLSILGAIEEGMGKSSNLLYTKSIIDGISSIALASSFGICIAFSSIPLLLYQGGLTLLAISAMKYMSEAMITNMTAVGGILLIGLGISILKIKEIHVISLVPSLIIIVILSYFFS